MTIEHEEAVRLAEKHGGIIVGVYPEEDAEIIFSTEQLAALVAEVRRDIPAELFDGYVVLKAIPEGKHVSADHVSLVLDAVVELICARLEEGKHEH